MREGCIERSPRPHVDAGQSPQPHEDAEIAYHAGEGFRAPRRLCEQCGAGRHGQRGDEGLPGEKRIIRFFRYLTGERGESPGEEAREERMEEIEAVGYGAEEVVGGRGTGQEGGKAGEDAVDAMGEESQTSEEVDA